MRIALIADIHGNLVALETLLRHLVQLDCDATICLGDVAGFGPQPRACLHRVHDLGIPVVMGNADADLLETPERGGSPEAPDVFGDIDRWCAAQLGNEDRAIVRDFSPTLRRTLPGDATLLCYHGSPASYDDGIRATTPGSDLDPVLTDRAATVLAGGHTHEPMVRRHREHLIVNPGSVGLPYEWLDDDRVRNPPWAEFAVLEATERSLEVALGRVPVDAAQVVRAARESGMPHAEAWTDGWA